MIYKITFFDANGPAFASGVVPFFTEDIDDFERNYFSEENAKKHRLEKQKERYFRSKAGENVTDYYTDDPEYNIFQFSESGHICQRKSFHYKNRTFKLYNGYSCPVEIYAAETTIDMAEISFKKKSDDVGKRFLVTKYSMSGVCRKDFFSDKYVDCTPYGNPIFTVHIPEGLPYKGEKEMFAECTLSTFAWEVLSCTECRDDDAYAFDITEPTDEELCEILCDIPGDAG